MRYAFLASIVAASLLGAAAMSVVHAAEAPAAPQNPQAQDEAANAHPSKASMALLPVDVDAESTTDHSPHRDSYYGQGFESRGINVDKLPRSGPGYGHRPTSN